MKKIVVIISAIILCQGIALAQKPNILFIFSDDQSFETIGTNGQTIVKTPNLDKLTKVGTTFTNAYNMGSWSGAVCVSSRAMLITGSHLWQAEKAVKACREREQKSWPEMMSEAGYTTYMSGKWHVGVPAKNIFNEVTHVRAGMPKSIKKAYNRPVKEEDPATAWYPWDIENGGFWEGGKHWSEVLADDGISFIEKAKKDDKPFFMYLAFNAPHDPRQAPKEYVDMYPLEKMEVPKNYLPLYPEMNANGVPKIRDENLAPYPRTEYAIKIHRQEYYASITHMDSQIGKILDALEASGKADNTIIIFTSDHGLAVGHHGLLGKQNMYEHSMRVPFIISGPGIKTNSKNNTPIYLQDAMATTLDLADYKTPSYVAFKSILPLTNDKKKNNYDKIYGAYQGKQRMIIEDNWKLIAYPKLKKKKLFNLKKDPLEMIDLASNSKYAKKLKELTMVLEGVMDDKKDPMTSLAAADFSK